MLVGTKAMGGKGGACLWMVIGHCRVEKRVLNKEDYESKRVS